MEVDLFTAAERPKRILVSKCTFTGRSRAFSGIKNWFCTCNTAPNYTNAPLHVSLRLAFRTAVRVQLYLGQRTAVHAAASSRQPASTATPHVDGHRRRQPRFVGAVAAPRAAVAVHRAAHAPPMVGPTKWSGAKKRAKRPQTQEAKRSLLCSQAGGGSGRQGKHASRTKSGRP